MRAVLAMIALGAAVLAVPAAAQLGLPGVGLPPLDLPGETLARTLDAVSGTVEQTERSLRLRTERIERLVRRNRDLIELDASGDPARRGELLLLDPAPAALTAVTQAGFVLAGQERMDTLGIAVVRLKLPPGTSLKDGEALLKRLAPEVETAPDNLHFQSGSSPLPLLQQASASVPAAITTPIGVIDGAPAQEVTAVRGFAKGAPVASNHGSAVVSLLTGAGARNLRVADIFGTDPAGGNALALVRGLDWLIAGGAKVVSISLSGPSNSVVAKAIQAAQRKGVAVLAAVGNDGPAAPPSYPASYPGVVAVTAVDGRARVLIEAGRAAHLDYAAPGADIAALDKAGKWTKVRGTSYAVPLAAARAAAAFDRGVSWRSQLDSEAEDLGPRGVDDRYGRGLLCRGCARRR